MSRPRQPLDDGGPLVGATVGRHHGVSHDTERDRAGEVRLRVGDGAGAVDGSCADEHQRQSTPGKPDYCCDIEAFLLLCNRYVNGIGMFAGCYRAAERNQGT